MCDFYPGMAATYFKIKPYYKFTPIYTNQSNTSILFASSVLAYFFNLRFVLDYDTQ